MTREHIHTLVSEQFSQCPGVRCMMDNIKRDNTFKDGVTVARTTGARLHHQYTETVLNVVLVRLAVKLSVCAE